MRLPSKLRPGDRIRVVAPSGVFSRARLETGVQLLIEAGFEPLIDEQVFSCERYLAGSDERRSREFSDALTEAETTAIWIARGGYGITRILPELSIERIAEANKWLIGFSDVTALHCAWARAGLASVHGPNMTTLDTWTVEARDELFALLGTDSEQEFLGESHGGTATVEGWLAGGNLTVLGAMAGTGMLPSLDGAVLMFEDIGERPYRLDRTLTQLIQAGLFDGVRGLCLGQLTRCEGPTPEDDPYTALDVVLDVLAPLNLPILTGLPIGHETSSRAVLFGAKAVLDPARGSLLVRPAGQ